MTEKTSKNTSTKHDPKTVALAAGVNTLLAVQLKNALDNDEGDMFSVVLAAMAHIVRAFEGEEEAAKLIDGYTNGAFSKMDSMVDAGLSPEEAATLATKEKEVVH